MRYYLHNRFLLLFTLLLIVSCSLLQAAEYTVKTVPNVHLSDRYNYVSNPDGILSIDGVQVINALLKTIEDSLGIEVAVVAIESIGQEDARHFATLLFEEWGLGKKNKDNGLLIQLITEPSQRSVVFETGYGIEGVLPDAITYRLQQRYMVPDMREGNYTAGMVKGVQAVKEYLLASDYERMAMTEESGEDETLAIIGYVLFFIVFVLMFVYLPIFGQLRKRCPVCKKRKLARTKVNVVKAATRFSSGMAEDTFVCKNCGHTERRSRYLPRIQSGGGGPFVGGGGSFGGGRSGGGSWGGGRSGGGGSISRF